jgi:hypothetical protein
MSAYVPEFVYGFTGWDKRNQPTYGLLPWPAHLRPTMKSATVSDLPEMDAAALMKEPPADGVFFLMLDMRDRTTIGTTIERLIAALDTLDGDENLEATGDDEQSHGWTGEGRGTVGLDNTACHDDEREVENEHGGDIQDEPHDARDEGDDEPFLGWHETCGQGAVGLEGWSRAEQAGVVPVVEGSLNFDGDGYHDGQKLLADLRKRHPGRRQDHVRVSPAIGRNRP